MLHNDAVSLLSSCPCPCHRAPSLKRCWCHAERAAHRPEVSDEQLRALARAGLSWDPPALAHNDAVRALGRCHCACHRRGGPCTCSARTDPALAAALTRKEERDLQRRLVTGRARPSEYLRHAPHLLPGMHRPRGDTER